MRYAIKFSKEGMLKYTSHLDMIRFFKRVFNRANILLMYSQGFNPHPKMTFAQPLSLGYTGIIEIIEIETKEDIKPEDMHERLNEQMPPGMKILSCEYLSEEDKGIAGRITQAQYRITIDQDLGISKEDIDRFLKEDTIVVLKKQKKKKGKPRGMKEVNIRSKIRSLSMEIVDDKYVMLTDLDCGSESNLNPDLLLQGMENYFKFKIDHENVEIQRNFLK